MSAAAPEAAPWPFLVVLISPTAAAKGEESAGPPRVHGLGWIAGEHVVTLSHVAERAGAVLRPDDGLVLPFEQVARDGTFAVLRVDGELTRGRDATPARMQPGAQCTVAMVRDDAPVVRLVAGGVEKPGPDGRFTVFLEGRLPEDYTASGSPVVAADGTVFGIVGPTATSASVDAFDLDELLQLIPEPRLQDEQEQEQEQPDETSEPTPSPVSVELAGGISTDRVDPTEGIPLDRDQLGVRDYVTMFATVIADTQTPMPLSFGLFGEWGSGKSTFMGLLRAEVDELARSGDPRYHRQIVQIGFNAWHYSDSNLWASLGDEIFGRLAGPGETNEARRERLQAELGEKLQRRKELDEAAKHATAEIARLNRGLDDASLAGATTAREFLDAALGAPELGVELRRALERLGVAGEAEQARLLASELSQAPDDVKVVRQALGTWRRWALLACLTAAVAAVVAGLLVATPWLTGGGIALVTGVAAAAGWLIARVRSGAQLLHQVADGLRREKATKLAAKLEELRRAQAEQQVLEAQLGEVTAQVGELGRELTELGPGRQLYRFIAERAASGTYRGQLGLISTIRKDFEQLIALMNEWQTRQPTESDPSPPPPIDRIVLYIDDLDRCSPEQVVDVLQAVHLLLALELFVVVVGVDPRWLLRALRRQYRAMLTSGARPTGQDPWWETTPQDYLEKIFNIPFALPRMSHASFEQLVRSLAQQQAETGTTPRTVVLDAVEPGAPEPAAGDGTGGVPVEVEGRPHVATADIPVEAGSEVAALQSETAEVEVRPLTDGELTMLAALAPLVDTPRETKRLLNLYRMIRSTRNLSPASRFLGDDGTPGDHQAVVILLGLLSGHARLLEDVLAAPKRRGVKGGLRSRAPDERWGDFVAGMRPRQARSSWTNDVVGSIGETDLPGWTRLADGLAQASGLVGIPDLRPFQLWAPRIARFSFLLSPYAQEEAASPPAAAVPARAGSASSRA